MSSLSDEVRATFEKAALRHEAAKGLDGEEWARYRRIHSDHDAQVRFEQRAFELEYRTRFEIARKRLIAKAGDRHLALKHRWFGQDRFDKAAIDRQADRDVRAAHRNLLTHLEARRNEALDALFAESGQDKRLRDMPRDDFASAVDRRCGEERRRGRRRE